MSEIEQDVETSENNEQDLDLELEDSPDEGEDKEIKEKTEEKSKETPEARLARLERQTERLRKKLGKSEESKPESKEKATKLGELDYGQLAFYNTKSDAVRIESDEDIEFLKETMKDTGKSQQALLDSKWFQSELKERAELKRSSEATPKGGKRPGNSPKDSVDHWLAKGELPENTPENQELRRKVVNARYARETSTNKFSHSATGSIVRQSQLRK